MEYQLDLKKNSKDPQTSGRTEEVISTRASQSLKLQDRFRLERPSPSYADFHHEITQNADDLPSEFSGKYQKPQIGRKAAEDDELVKYMSYLPSYLERGNNFQEKALNVGVLDWGRLEKWKHSLKQTPCSTGVYSVSSSNASPFFSTDGSSTHSISGQFCSPRQRMHRPTLQSHLEASHPEISSQGVKSFGGNADKFHDHRVSQTDTFDRQQEFSKMDKPSGKNLSEAKLDQNMKKDLDRKIIAEMGSSSHLETCEGASSSNAKMKTSEVAKKAEKSKKLHTNVVDRDCLESQNRVVLLVPRDLSETSSSGVTRSCSSTAITGQRSTVASRRNFTDRSSATEVHSREFYSDIPHSCTLPGELENNEHTPIRQSSSMDAQSIESSSDVTDQPRSVKVFISPSRTRRNEEKSTRLPTDSTIIKPPQVSDQKTSTVAAEKVRYPSPTRLLSMGISRISRSINSKEDPNVQKLSLTHVTTKPGQERNVTSACLDNSGTGKQNPTNKSRSSPLRRLLDPLLKSTAADFRRSSEPVRKGSTSSERACKSSEGQLESSAPHSVKVKLDLKSCKTINVKDSFRIKQDGSPAVQALLQVAIKNGLPLFTFAVDDNNEILAATMRKLDTSVKDDHSCLYTFFTIREIKKKSWINQGGKGKGHDFIPNVIAQMKVSDYQFSNSARHNSKDYFRMREFVLFTVDLRQEGQHTSDFQSNDELAAIVVKIPNETTSSIIQDRQQSDDYGSQDHRSTTVILPSGVHSISSKGGPSSLIERWISGGVCDCGGWDLGCKLRVLGDGNQINKKSSSSSRLSTTDQFDIFDQEGVQENQSVFSLAPFREGICSVAFNSSLSHLQAFSICIAALDSGKLSGLSDSNDSLQGKTSDDTISMKNDGIKALNGMETEAPLRYVSYPPPLSPVGRV